LVFTISFFVALYNCNDKNKKGLIKKNTFVKCVGFSTFNYTIISFMSVFIIAIVAMMGANGGGGFSFGNFLYTIDGDITNKKYERLYGIIRERHPKNSDIELYNLTESAKKMYGNTEINKLYKSINNKTNNNKKKEIKDLTYGEIYKFAKNKKQPYTPPSSI